MGGILCLNQKYNTCDHTCHCLELPEGKKPQCTTSDFPQFSIVHTYRQGPLPSLHHNRRPPKCDRVCRPGVCWVRLVLSTWYCRVVVLSSLFSLARSLPSRPLSFVSRYYSSHSFLISITTFCIDNGIHFFKKRYGGILKISGRFPLVTRIGTFAFYCAGEFPMNVDSELIFDR